MQEKIKILKSLNMAGVEWELRDAPLSSPGFVAPMAHVVRSGAGIMEIAKGLAAMPDIPDAIKSFREHPLFGGAKNTVPPILCAKPKLIVITDIPSLADDNSGAILSGAEGEFFDKMLGAIGLARKDCAISPLVFWRPAGGRTPTKEELSFCRPFIDRIIADAPETKILTLGALAAKEIADAALPRDHGKMFGNVIPIYRPDFVMANPLLKRDVWNAIKGLG
jgi:DNA polymerase